jgi:hypothetical protein
MARRECPQWVESGQPEFCNSPSPTLFDPCVYVISQESSLLTRSRRGPRNVDGEAIFVIKVSRGMEVSLTVANIERDAPPA